MNFALILLVLVVISGIAWLADVFRFQKQRERKAQVAVAAFDEQRRLEGVGSDPALRQKIATEILRQPWWLEYTASFFPVILVVFVLRSFVAEPFKIPSGSMIPTLRVGDFILVNKFAYGVRLPVINTKVVNIGSPQRGDVMVFKYPKDESLDYIKRVIGLPGDVVQYQNKTLSINGTPLEYKRLPDFLDETRLTYSLQYTEKLGEVEHSILNDADRSGQIFTNDSFPFFENCSYVQSGVTCKVPPGHYFMMGDNRDNSADSRFWGFVPEKNIVGKAFFVWMNLGDLKRIGRFQ